LKLGNTHSAQKMKANSTPPSGRGTAPGTGEIEGKEQVGEEKRTGCASARRRRRRATRREVTLASPQKGKWEKGKAEKKKKKKRKRRASKKKKFTK